MIMQESSGSDCPMGMSFSGKGVNPSYTLFIIGIPICEHTAKRMGVHDHPAIVWDEIVGYLLTMTFAPAGWPWVIAGFALFRLFDIAKPWPIRVLDRKVGGGFGIMIDDLLAAVFAAGVLQLLVVYVAPQLS